MSANTNPENSRIAFGNPRARRIAHTSTLLVSIYFALLIASTSCNALENAIALKQDSDRGVEFVVALVLDDSDDEEQLVQETIDKLGRRLDWLELRDVSMQYLSEGRIKITIPRVDDLPKVREFLFSRMYVEFRNIHYLADPRVSDDEVDSRHGGFVPLDWRRVWGQDEEELLKEHGGVLPECTEIIPLIALWPTAFGHIQEYLLVEQEPLQEERFIKRASARDNVDHDACDIMLELSDEGAQLYQWLLTQEDRRYLVMVVDGIGVRISNNETNEGTELVIEEEMAIPFALDFEFMLNEGPLPAPLVIESETPIGEPFEIDSQPDERKCVWPFTKPTEPN